MSLKITFEEAQEHLAVYLKKAVKDNKVIIICRPNKGDAAIISASKLRSLMETVHLLSSPRNA